MKITVVVGTRPEIIKMSPIIKELERQGMDYYIVHTGQHYSYSMDGMFFSELGLPQPKYNLDVGSRPHGLGVMVHKAEIVLVRDRPDIVLVEGDTNTVLAGALAANQLHIKVGHVEAGLRSYNRLMPEETNRILTDHCSDLLFAPTESAKQILLGEGINESQIFVTGNTIVDALYLMARKMGRRVSCSEPYALATIHRQENVDNRDRFANILECLERVNTMLTVVYPIHPRAKMRAVEHHLNLDSIKVVEPLGYLDFLELEKNATLVLTDSGGVQEEACILGIPCVTLRDETERTETVGIGANMVAGVVPERVLECVEIMRDRKNRWLNPFGDGKAGERIVEIIRRHYG